MFHFDVQGSVAKSTHAGIPWLRYIRQRLGERVHFWPFDGWDIPAGRSAVTEVYPALWSRSFARADRTGDQHDAYSIAAWLCQAQFVDDPISTGPSWIVAANFRRRPPPDEASTAIAGAAAPTRTLYSPRSSSPRYPRRQSRND